MISGHPENNRERLLKIVEKGFEITRGRPLPLGATVKRGGINFAVFSKHATLLTLVIFSPDEIEPIIEFPLDPRCNRTGNIWHAFVKGIDPRIQYGYRAAGPSGCDEKFLLFNYDDVLIDPYARALSDGGRCGKYTPEKERGESPVGRALRSVVVDHEFNWEFDQPLDIHLADSIIYEMHVRGFTIHPSSGVAHPGTFSGIAEKAPYLKDLGVTAVELMPVTEFDETDNLRVHPVTKRPLRNFWGYHPLNFFSPKAGYSCSEELEGPITEFKSMVKTLHEAGIEVILDMVFNHTGEGDKTRQSTSFRGLDNKVYYMMDPDTGEYLNFSGCGNTINCNHPVVRDMILDCLCYWVTEMHVDGFRFDLASIMGRGREGQVLRNPPLLERIAANPVLANTKLIAEAWDAAGLYQVGTFPNWGRWAEWNGKFRDDVRRFVKGDAGMVSALATRLTGSADLYKKSRREPFHSINFVTSHDGFTLKDLVSYDRKHNEINGENCRDGENENLSWNGGEEGPSDSEEIQALRNRQVRNMASILMLSWGVPMILGGDEMGRTQKGNNNAYCQDNEITWVDWDLLEKNRDLFRFFQRLIKFRKMHPVFRRRAFLKDGSEEDLTIAWHGFENDRPDWSENSRSVALCLSGRACPDEIFIINHAHWESQVFEIPSAGEEKRWRRFLDTSLVPPFDISEPGQEPGLENQITYPVGPRSVVVLVAKTAGVL